MDSNSMHSSVSKQRLKDAVRYFEYLLLEKNLIAEECSSIITEEAMTLGREIYNNTIDILNNKKIIIKEELIIADESDEKSLYADVEEGNDDSSDDFQPKEKKQKSDVDVKKGDNDSSDDFQPKEKKQKSDADVKKGDNDSSDDFQPEEKEQKSDETIPLEYKIKVLNMVKAHPTWNLKTLQKKGCSRLKNMSYLARWEKQIEKGGTTQEKRKFIDSWTYDRFKEAQENFHQVTTKNLQQWALDAASQFKDFEFKASNGWIRKFKRRHDIR